MVPYSTLFISLSKTPQEEPTHRKSERIRDLVILVNHRKSGNWTGIMRLPNGTACRFINAFVGQNFFQLPRTILLGISMTSSTWVSNETINQTMRCFSNFWKTSVTWRFGIVLRNTRWPCVRSFMVAISLCCCPAEQGWVWLEGHVLVVGKGSQPHGECQHVQ